MGETFGFDFNITAHWDNLNIEKQGYLPPVDPILIWRFVPRIKWLCQSAAATTYQKMFPSVVFKIFQVMGMPADEKLRLG